MELLPERVVAVAADRYASAKHGLVVLWLTTASERREYQLALLRLRESLPLVPLIVHASFENTNAISSDLAQLIEEHREDFVPILTADPEASPIIVVLLARTELGVPQLSSPAMLPNWLPRIGGTTTEVVVENLLTTARAPLNAPEARIADVCQTLFELEDAVLRRLESVFEADHSRSGAILERLADRAKPNEQFAEFLANAKAARALVTNPSGFRPTATDGRSFVGRLMRRCSETSPDGLNAVSAALVTSLALEVGATFVRESLPAVLGRSSQRETRSGVRTARNLIITIVASTQFVTGAAHADDYPNYLVVHLQATSYDLREVLRALSEMIRGLPLLPPRKNERQSFRGDV